MCEGYLLAGALPEGNRLEFRCRVVRSPFPMRSAARLRGASERKSALEAALYIPSELSQGVALPVRLSFGCWSRLWPVAVVREG